ncbi:MAG TPA: response regulator [Bryobacteraceae bacterium]|jgi:DNA-binding NtrC family response regulator|nr:response regulator [Bryobacteraceae bacterium]
MAHLLIVDDDASTLGSLARAFRLAGHEATVCDNANRALELVKSQPFDMMLSDVVMPCKDGFTLLEELRNLGIMLPVVSDHKGRIAVESEKGKGTTFRIDLG